MVSNDYTIKADDGEVIKQVLSYKAPEYKVYTEALPEKEHKAWCDYCLRQKNFERVVEYTIAELKLKKDFEDIIKNKLIEIEFNRNNFKQI